MREETFTIHPDGDAARRAAHDLFVATRSRLWAVLPAWAEISHVGATAIPDCLTKGDLDIVVRVPPDQFRAADAALACMYQRNTGSTRDHSFSAFEDAAASPPLGIQLTAIGGPHDVFHFFLDALLAQPERVAEYNSVKRAFVGRSMADYRAAKNVFIANVLAG